MHSRLDSRWPINNLMCRALPLSWLHSPEGEIFTAGGVSHRIAVPSPEGNTWHPINNFSTTLFSVRKNAGRSCKAISSEKAFGPAWRALQRISMPSRSELVATTTTLTDSSGFQQRWVCPTLLAN